MFPRPATECASVEATTGRPPRPPAGHRRPRGRAGRQAVRLDRDPGLERDLEDGVEVERVGRPVVDDAPVRVAQARGRRMAHRLDHALRETVARLALSRVEADLHPLELREHVVGEVERRRPGGCRPRSRAGSGTAPAPRWRRRSPRPADGRRRRRARGRRARCGCGRRSRRTRTPAPGRRHPARAPTRVPSDQVVWQWRSPRISRARRAPAARR